MARIVVRAPVVLLIIVGCANEAGGHPMTDSLRVTSTAFGDGDAIPMRHTCDGEDRSPPLEWSGAPPGAVAYALVVDDPDARGFVHWAVTDIDVTSLAEGASAGTEGRNDFGRTGYGGPCPPSGTHRYAFTVHALSERLGLEPGFDADELSSALEGRVLASGRLTATYARQRGG